MNMFSPGDHVRLRSDVYDDGIVLMECENETEFYFVVFCKGSGYNCQPWIRKLHVDKLTLVKKEAHKPDPPPKFKR